MSKFQNINDVWTYLNTIPMFQKVGASAANFTLDNISLFCEKIGNPQNSFPTVHIAGTNGKGTTAYLLEHIYQQEGVKTGVFTSPHLIRYNERIKVNGEEISDLAIVQFFQLYGDLLAEIKLSYFEISTVLAFWYMAREQVQIAFIEAGLGGRLDSTNIITPKISVITSIGLDHQQILGNSIAEIAKEKAGVIKPGIPVVLGNVEDEALAVINERAGKLHSTVHKAKDLHLDWKDGLIILHYQDNVISLQSLLIEDVNKWNVGCAWLVWQLLTPDFTLPCQNFKKAVETFKGAAGRFEKLHTDYNWFFSGSHNMQALGSSMKAIHKMKSNDDAVVIFSAMKDKVSSELLKNFSSFKIIYFVEQKGERAAKIEDIKPHLDVLKMDENNADIILNELKSALVIFTGSFYFYPIVKRWISKL